MNTRLSCLSLAGAALLLSACSGEVEDTLPGQPIKHRQEAFKEILRQFEPFGEIAKQRAPDLDQAKAQASALMAVRDVPWDYFTDDSNQPPTKALPALWQNRDDFDAKHEDFIKATDALMSAAEEERVEDLKRAIGDVEQSCKACHKPYRR